MLVQRNRLGLLLLVLAAGCSTRGDNKTDQPKGEAKASEKAASVAEGAMCKEHGILEAICTKCNPRLIPIFKAKGDWCQSHDFPESVCPLCHPERGGKPVADVSSDGAPPDGTKVRFKT